MKLTAYFVVIESLGTICYAKNSIQPANLEIVCFCNEIELIQMDDNEKSIFHSHYAETITNISKSDSICIEVDNDACSALSYDNSKFGSIRIDINAIRKAMESRLKFKFNRC